jgi:hypothetical protein
MGMRRSAAEIIREYGPFTGADRVGGVTYDGQNVWFASGGKLNAFDPASGEAVRSIDVTAHAGTAFDGELWHATLEADESELRRVDPRTGEVLERIEMPPGMGVSGLESDGGSQFFCGGASSGKVRAVRRPNRG